MSKQIEEAQALGFDSIEQMNEHQAWLKQQETERKKARAAALASNLAHSPIIDMR